AAPVLHPFRGRHHEIYSAAGERRGSHSNCRHFQHVYRHAKLRTHCLKNYQTKGEQRVMITGLFWLALTLLIYALSKRLYQAKPSVYLSPLLVTPIVLVIGLMWAHIPYESYNSGGKWLSDMLQPATIAFAVPLYKYYNVLKKHAAVIIVSVISGSIIAIISSAV